MLSYAFLYDNSTSLTTAQGYEWTRILELPRQIRFLEFGAVVVAALLLLVRRRSRTSLVLAAGVLMFASVALCSYVPRPVVTPTDFGRLVYMYILPVLVFVIAHELSWSTSAITRLVRFILLSALVSAAVSWTQYLYFGYEVGDDITGLNQDAHSNASLLMVATFLLLVQGLFFRRRTRLLLGLGTALTAVLSSALKLLIMAPALAATLRYYSRTRGRASWGISNRATAAITLATVFSGALFMAFSRVDTRSAKRMPAFMERLANDPLSLGPIEAHRDAATRLFRGAQPLIFGYGPFSYSNPISMGQTREGGALGQYVTFSVKPDESGEDMSVTLTTSLAVEFGLPAFFILVWMYVTILHSVIQCTRSHDVTVRAYAAAAVPALVLLLASAALAQFGSISALSLSWPVMLLSGAVCRLAADTRLVTQP